MGYEGKHRAGSEQDRRMAGYRGKHRAADPLPQRFPDKMIWPGDKVAVETDKDK